MDCTAEGGLGLSAQPFAVQVRGATALFVEISGSILFNEPMVDETVECCECQR